MRGGHAGHFSVSSSGVSIGLRVNADHITTGSRIADYPVLQGGVSGGSVRRAPAGLEGKIRESGLG